MAKVSVKKKLQYWGTGRRKKAIARVRLIPAGTGQKEFQDIVVSSKEDYLKEMNDL